MGQAKKSQASLGVWLSARVCAWCAGGGGTKSGKLHPPPALRNVGSCRASGVGIHIFEDDKGSFSAQMAWPKGYSVDNQWSPKVSLRDWLSSSLSCISDGEDCGYQSRQSKKKRAAPRLLCRSESEGGCPGFIFTTYVGNGGDFY